MKSFGKNELGLITQSCFRYYEHIQGINLINRDNF